MAHLDRLAAQQTLELLAEMKRRRDEERYRYYTPHRGQLPFHTSLKRNRWGLGGNRSGKTVAGAMETVWFATGEHPHREIKGPTQGWVVSLDFGGVRDITRPMVEYWMPKGMVLKYYEKDNIMVLKNGSEIGFKSCDSGREKFQGTSKDYIWFDEEPPEDVYTECLLRTLDCKGNIWGTMTPLKGLTWVYDTIYLNEKNDPEVFCIVMSVEDNPYIDLGELARVNSLLTEDEKEARMHGRFVSRTGLIYPHFSEGIHVCKPFEVPNDWNKYRAIDPGFRNSLACLFAACDRDDTLYITDEHVKAEMALQDHAFIIKQKTGDQRPYTVIDPAANQKGLQNEKSVKEQFRVHGIHTTNANNSVWTGIQRVSDWLKIHPMTQKPRIIIFDTCTELIRELKRYRWADEAKLDRKDGPEKPMKKDDHACDALRYLVMANPHGRRAPIKPAGKITKNKITGY